MSLALRDSAVVADSTRRKVQKVAREMGYIYNRSAASLRTSRTNILGVAFHDVANPYFAEMLAAVDETVRSTGRIVLLGTCNDNGAGRRTCSHPSGSTGRTASSSARQRLVGGQPATHRRDRDADRHGLPEIEGLKADFVGADDRRATELAVFHLADLGHRRIAYVGGDDATSNGRHRHRSFVDSLAARGLTAIRR